MLAEVKKPVRYLTEFYCAVTVRFHPKLRLTRKSFCVEDKKRQLTRGANESKVATYINIFIQPDQRSFSRYVYDCHDRRFKRN